MTNIWRILLILLVIGFAGMCAYFYPQLPATMASHFDGEGQPDNFSSKQGYFILMSTVAFFAAVVPYLVTALIGGLSLSWLNVPNKEYWMAAERRQQTLKMIQGRFEFFAVAQLALLAAINLLVIRANLEQAPLSGASLGIILAFVVFAILWSIGFYRMFQIPARPIGTNFE
jgi:uncharacterized membrane protein